MVHTSPRFHTLLSVLSPFFVIGCEMSGMDLTGAVGHDAGDDPVSQSNPETPQSTGADADGGAEVTGGGAAGDHASNDGSVVAFDFDCIKIDRISDPTVLPPAGLRVKFRVLDCNGDPIGQLPSGAVVVYNDEKGEAFGEGLEGGSVSELAVPSSYGLSSVLALDLSESVFNSGVLDQLIDGALRYLDAVQITPAPGVEHRVALTVFGRPEAHRIVSDFTVDFDLLRAELEALRAAESLGTTDLYGAYIAAIEMLGGMDDCGLELTESFVVIMSDGTHEAGNEEIMRGRALDALQRHPELNVYAIGIDGNYDERKLAELASTEENFVHVKDADQLGRAFGEVAFRVDAVAKSNYVVGICTPIALGDSASLTIEIKVDGSEDIDPSDRATLSYPVASLDGDVASCDANAIAASSVAGSGVDVEDGGECACGEDNSGNRSIYATVRDFRIAHPDFQSALGTDRGIVGAQLGEDRNPVYAGSPSTPTTTTVENFDQWYRDVEGVNTALPLELPLVEISPGLWEYRSTAFFPIDGQGYGNEGNSHNYHFTLETHLSFPYRGGESFVFSGDDDLWLFVNGRLAIDLGGVHPAQTQSVNLDEHAAALGLVPGNTYTLALFFAERHTTESNFTFQTTMELSCE
ncbi:MAG: fibro-slime domain-containing protein [Nannocystaceae bacterium]